MANLKNITELPVAESAEGLNLIVNDNGAAKQIAASAVGAQADFSQNDSTKPDYVKNRTHWVEEEIILDRQTMDGFSDMGGGYGLLLSYRINFSDGDDVTVYWDGTEYDFVAIQGLIGNTLPLNNLNNGIPFVIMKEAIDDFSGIAVTDGSTATSHEIGIIKKTYHKLNAKYLPDNISDGYDLRIAFDYNFENTRLIKGDFSIVAEKLAHGITPNVELLQVADVNELFASSFSIHRVTQIVMNDNLIYFVYNNNDGDYIYIDNNNHVGKGIFD